MKFFQNCYRRKIIAKNLYFWIRKKKCIKCLQNTGITPSLEEIKLKSKECCLFSNVHQQCVSDVGSFILRMTFEMTWIMCSIPNTKAAEGGNKTQGSNTIMSTWLKLEFWFKKIIDVGTILLRQHNPSRKFALKKGPFYTILACSKRGFLLFWTIFSKN